MKLSGRSSRYILSAFVTMALLAGLAAPALAADTWAVDKTHSGVMFRADHLGFAYVWGRFNDFDGKVVINEAEPSKSSVELTINTASIDTNNQRRDDHLRNPDFFDATTFPEAVFKSTNVKKSGDNYTVTGDLTIRGVTKPVTLELERRKTGDFRGTTKTGFTGKTTIDRTDFGVAYMPGALGNEVELFIDIELNKQ